MASETIKKLNIRRGQVKAQLTRFTNFVEKFDKDKFTDCMELRARLDAATNILSEFNVIQGSIEEATILTDKDGTLESSASIEEREEFETKYFSSISRARNLLASKLEQEQTPPPPNLTLAPGGHSSSQQTNIKLPQIKLPEFTGTYDTWIQFIPPRSPHFGGLWEAAVKSVEHHLKRMLNNITLTFEEFYTFLVQIEAVLNSRPLTPMSQDLNDLAAITPGHFIIGEALTAVPERNLQHSPINHVTRFKHIQLMTQQFWSRWTKEYLHTLQQRSKWRYTQGPENLVGSLVLLKEDNVPPLHWPMGRILAVHPGEDGLIRVVSVKTKSGVMKRAVAKVCLLPK